MSKKKADEPKKAVLFGRVGTNLKMGIVGLPNVGKSTFFNLLCSQSIPAENYPFCTIEPNNSRVAVPDKRFDWLCEHHKPQSSVPAFLQVVDIAGLVKGASAGQGLGNAFLSHIKSVDGIFHMLRAFDATDIVHVEGDIDPIRDLQIIREELRLKDEEAVEKAYKELEKVCVRGNDKSKKTEYECITKARLALIEQKKDIRFCEWSGGEIEILNDHLFITSKPVVYLINMSEKDYRKKKNKWLLKIKEWIDANDPGASIIPFSVDFEQKYYEAKTEDDKKAFLDGSESALPKIIRCGYSALNLQYFFTCGKDEVKAWTIQKNSKAPQAAGRIHTEFEKGFIMAEIMSYEDFHELGSEISVKEAGKYRQRGREHVVEDGDIIFFKFNTPNAPKKK